MDLRNDRFVLPPFVLPLCLALAGFIITKLKPMDVPVVLPENKEIALESSTPAKICGIAVVIATLGLYAIFW